eukprot:1155233-Pelagomonas_calceolata.AAC.4
MNAGLERVIGLATGKATSHVDVLIRMLLPVMVGSACALEHTCGHASIRRTSGHTCGHAGILNPPGAVNPPL